MKSTWTKLRPAVLAKIKPTPTHTTRAKAAAKALSAAALAAAKPLRLRVEPVVVGSLAKGTHLRPKPDIDLFLLFDETVSRETLEQAGLKVGKHILKRPRLRYAEHPYVRGEFRGFDFDVVPAFRVKNGAGKLSAVDRSPFHAEYVRAHITARQQDEVRLLKGFLKGIGCYGAETATAGFSGYLAELLVLRFGSFWDSLVALREEMPPIRLALKGAAPMLGGDLVFVDPVDPSRNAAAAVGREKLDTFLRAARAFTAAPRAEFFWPKKPKTQTKDELYSHLSHRGVMGLVLPPFRVNEDAQVPHARRFSDKVGRALEDEGFTVVRHAVYPMAKGSILALWEYEPVALPPEFVHVGPPANAADHSRRFLEKWQSHPDALDLPHPVAGRWQVRLRRTRREAIPILRGRLSELLKGVDADAKSKKRIALKPGMEFAQDARMRPLLSRFLVPRDPWDPPS